MRLIITGGLGHIGTGLLNKIGSVKVIKEIIIIDKMLSNKIHTLFRLKSKKVVKIIEGDLLNINLNKIIKKRDLIIHLAAITNAPDSFKNKKKIFLNNFLSTKKIADVASKKKAKCIFFSSTSVYGSNDKIMYEDENNLNPQSPYAACKIKEEKYVKKISKSRHLESILLRLGTIFGVSNGMRFHTAVNKFCYQAALNKPLTVWKTAYNQKRPYLDLNDAIKCIKFIIKKNLFNNNIYNVATKNISTKDLLNNIKKHKKIKINLVSSKIMNQLSYEANCNKIKKKGFKFSGNLNKQIKHTIGLFTNIKNEV